MRGILMADSAMARRTFSSRAGVIAGVLLALALLVLLPASLITPAAAQTNVQPDVQTRAPDAGVSAPVQNRPAVRPRKGPPEKPLKVLTKIIPPFVMHGADGRLQGFSIDLWRAVSQRLGRESEIVLLPSLTVLLDDIRKGAGDIAIAAITITAEREKVMDFSYPYFRSGLQIMVRADEGSILAQALSVLKGMVTSRSFRIAMLALAVLVLITAHVIWLVERHRNPEFRHEYPQGLWDAVYWTVVTISTVGYGDKTPKTHMGRAIALVLIVFGYIAFAWFTATITSAVTITKLEGAINGPADLPGKRVATVRGSTSAGYLSRLPGVKVFLYDRIEDAYAMLEAGRVDAVVYDFPVLSHYAMTKGRDKVKLVGPVFQHEPYGIALPEGSPLREKINRALLSIQESGEYARLYQKWFGPAVK
ncbi:transporter substrate-binding domain-containing protein [Thermopetrobacter sp. TC1]|uniref:transporter substrate-binding domain-containing protein n=1 Tax=Thermopetrobacter sp. TC1 TaxID=1495045 RepID=UPI0018CDB7D6|nr:transporter substrate-binding domain-containing protein [Thermopetrobacter sp. TC1]